MVAREIRSLNAIYMQSIFLAVLMSIIDMHFDMPSSTPSGGEVAEHASMIFICETTLLSFESKLSSPLHKVDQMRVDGS